ncbi:S1/P1 nuclease [Leptospira weilii]|uniref:S1/P1 Nuclease n=1 Tax=Leptospira weilii str. UI 13098 TaxID=1088542 RepID=M6QBJ2_9LEPT|nr:S1/P1 nuclease [Leptospira weilii]EMN90585.1 S1/P1 Nuclease [Leptospira weilii str. UI 13098]MCL8265559.1 S1/P1 nuclease [Leptospira weilii]
MKTINRIKFTALTIIALLGNSNVYAWGHQGHKAIGIIAQHLLANSKEFEEINNILGGFTLEEISTCPDELRVFQSAKKPMSPVCNQIFTNPEPPTNTGSWHFIDTPISQSNHPTHEDIVKACKSACVITEIDRWSNILADATQANAKRLQALSFVVHFIGDIHQPLHVAERNHDFGGNKVKVRIGKYKTNLHSFWDTNLVDYISTNPISTTILLKSDIAFAQTEAQTTPETWALQGFQFARNVAYDGIPIDYSSIVKISNTYIQNAIPVVKHQLASAGVRLSQHLTKIFSSPRK